MSTELPSMGSGRLGYALSWIAENEVDGEVCIAAWRSFKVLCTGSLSEFDS